MWLLVVFVCLLFKCYSEPNRYLTITKKPVRSAETKERESFSLMISDITMKNIEALLEQDPLTPNDCKDQLLTAHRAVQNNHTSLPFSMHRGEKRRIAVPPIVNDTDEFRNFRISLPIHPYRQHILDAIDTHQVVVISGETGE